MAALAILAKQAGVKVTGSDLKETFVTDETLKRQGITWSVGFSEKNLVGRPDLVVVTGAHGGRENSEAVAAQKNGLKVVMQGEALGMFMEGYEGISVAGSHGKTTTAALLSFLLEKGGLSPTFAVGCGDISGLSGPAKLGKGKYFVAEADEYVSCPQTDKTPRFLWQNPKIAVVTNIEYDHPDVFANLEEVKAAFLEFVQKLPTDGLLVAGIDNPTGREIFAQANVNKLSYGFSPTVDWRITKVSFGEGKTFFWVEHQGLEMGQFTLCLPGRHNALNSLAAMIVGLNLGLDFEKIRQILPQFSGSKRRFELIGEVKGIKLYDDYAHHPTEISATLAAVKEWFPKQRLICIFQPHTYSRTKALFAEFAKAFKSADMVILTDIYSSAREEKDPEVSSQKLALKAGQDNPHVSYGGKMDMVVKSLGKIARPGDIILTMGAGDIFRWHGGILKSLEGMR